MAKETPRLKISYPEQGQSNYFDVYQDGMLSIDADVFAALSRPNVIIHGGGSVGWDFNSPDYELSFDENISVQLPQYGVAQSIAFSTESPLSVPPSHFIVIAGVSYGATSAGPATILASTQVTVDGNEVVLAWHNPTTNDLVFTTGLVLALGDTATGIQPQGGGGGGSISVTDGTHTVTPATTLTFTDGAAVVTDAGGGDAEVQIQLTTNFVVSASGDTAYGLIQDAIDDANAAFVATGLHQVIYIKPGLYLENLVIRQGLKIVGQANPQSKEVRSNYEQNPAAYVKVQGNHTFDTDRAVVAFHGISFVDNNNAVHLFEYSDNDGNTHNTIQFYDCSLSFFSPNAGMSLFSDESATTENTRYYFKDCFFLYTDGTVAFTRPMFFLGGEVIDFVDCEFSTKGYGATIYFDNFNGNGVAATFTRCILVVCDIGSGFTYGSLSTINYVDTFHSGPDRWCIAQDNGGDVNIVNSTCIQDSGGYGVAQTNVGGGTFFYDRSSFAPQSPISNNYGTSEAISKISPDQVEGQAATMGIGTLDLAGRYDITTVSVDTNSGAATIELPNAEKMQGVMFTVWDGGGNGSANNITVTSPATAGGVVGPYTQVVNDDGSLLLVATKSASSTDYCWRVVSYLY
jgi:hypothetical protein